MAGSCVPVDFNPQGPRGPRRHPPGSPDHGGDFNPQGPRGPRRGEDTLRWMRWSISIHKALAGLDETVSLWKLFLEQFQSTRPSRASTFFSRFDGGINRYFNPQGPRGPRHKKVPFPIAYDFISIHKALAGLDSKTIQQSLHIPLTFYALCPPLLISTSSIHSPSQFSRLFRCF